LGLHSYQSPFKSAQVNEYIKHAKDFGIEASGTPQFEAIIKRSRGVADKMSKGVQFLMKKIRLMSLWVLAN
jgi:dihydrolipoamide dehydrogenase